MTMEVGDLVKMKYSMWWKLRTMPTAKRYTDQMGIVVGVAHNSIKVNIPGEGRTRTDLVEHWEKVEKGDGDW
jgi:ribosomal protein L21E